MSKNIGKNDEAWEKIFFENSILDKIEQNGIFNINAAEINKYREARLMTKFDNESVLPNIFKKNNLSILPITRGTYVISDFKAYNRFDESMDSETIYMPIPDYIESFDYKNIKSEAIALNSSFVSGILNNFLDEEKLFPSINGRMSSGEFDFKISTKNKSELSLNIKNSQIEIDGGFEGINSIAIIEAKNIISDDFLVRQLYYPYRLFKNKFKKRIRTIFLVYSNGIYNLYEYKFADPQSYNSLYLSKFKKYSIDSTVILKKDLENVFLNIKIAPEPKISFPQADSFIRLINLLELLSFDYLDKEKISSEYSFTDRQVNYYTDALRYLGLVKKGSVSYILTPLGEEIINTENYKVRQLKLVGELLKRRVFYNCFKIYLTKNIMPSKDEIIEIMRNSGLYNIKSESTYKRRASTVRAWLSWIVSLIKK